MQPVAQRANSVVRTSDRFINALRCRTPHISGRVSSGGTLFISVCVCGRPGDRACVGGAAAKASLQARHEPSNRPADAPSEGDSEAPEPSLVPVAPRSQRTPPDVGHQGIRIASPGTPTVMGVPEISRSATALTGPGTQCANGFSGVNTVLIYMPC